MVSTHAAGSRHANLRNAKTSDVSSEVTCPECILVMNKRVMNDILEESSTYQHSARKGVDFKRKLPEWAILGFKSYTTPNYMIRSVVNGENPESFFENTHNTILVTLRNLDPSFDSTAYLEAFIDMWNYFFEHFFEHTNVRVNFTITNAVLTYRDHEINALSVNSDLGYLVQYILMIMIGKMVNILVEQPESDKFRLMEQIFSNQANTSMRNYRCFLKVLLNGDIVDLWANPSSYTSLVPQVLGFDDYESILPPSWLSIHLKYKSEIKLSERGLYY